METQTSQGRRPVVMDCDPGTDDALAILMVAAAPQIDLLALTTVAGNVPAELTARNALALAELLDLDVPVTAGARPLMRSYEPLDPKIMGVGGLGATRLPEPTRPLDPRTSAELLYELACRHPGELEILATGPLTNVALMLAEHPDARELVRGVTLMGGSVNGGNTTPAAEFNIYTDAEAARIVFRSGVSLTMVGLDVCYQNRLRGSDLASLAEKYGALGRFVGELFFWPDGGARPFPERGVPVFDALAAAALIDPACMSSEHLHVDVETAGELTYGETVVDVDGRLGLPANTDVVMGCDHERFLALVELSVRELASAGASGRS